MNIIKTQRLSPTQFSAIDKLWNDEYPVKLKDRFALLLEGVENYEHYLIEDETKKVLAWAVWFEKDAQIRFSIIVSKGAQGKGFGTLLMNKLKQDHKEFYGWVIDHNEDVKAGGEYYQSPMSFYVKQGMEILHDKRIDTEMIRAVLVKWSEK